VSVLLIVLFLMMLFRLSIIGLVCRSICLCSWRESSEGIGVDLIVLLLRGSEVKLWL